MRLFVLVWYIGTAAFIWWCAWQLLSFLTPGERILIVAVACLLAWMLWVTTRIALPNPQHSNGR